MRARSRHTSNTCRQIKETSMCFHSKEKKGTAAPTIQIDQCSVSQYLFPTDQPHRSRKSGWRSEGRIKDQNLNNHGDADDLPAATNGNIQDMAPVKAHTRLTYRSRPAGHMRT
jgi:hypothetical protein